MNLPGLRPEQQATVGTWLPGATLVADHSWRGAGRAVLQLRHAGHDVVVKAGRPDDHHMEREIRAHREVVTVLAQRDLAARVLHAAPDLHLLATTYLPGVLVEGTAVEREPDTYRQAGHALAVLHEQGSRPPGAYEDRMDAVAIERLSHAHRIERDVVERLRAELASPVPPRPLVPTHGDWQPRNWVVDGGRLAVIDFGRADWRPAATDLARLATQQFRGRDDLERAHLEGYGPDPRTPESWRRDLLREGIATAVWAYRVGDEPFERHGLRVVADVLAHALDL